MEFKKKDKYSMDDLLQIMKILRAPGGCPWDREQTHQSIRNCFIEETYEAIEAIDTEDPILLQEELGDVLLQVLFHSEIEQEEGRFDFSDVVDGEAKKMVERHPHVFGSVTVDGTEDVLTNWDAIKKKTKDHKTQTEVLQSVSKALPALMRSQKVQQKAAKVGFDWPDVSGALAKVEEETAELREAIRAEGVEACAEELGDLLFSVVNVARFLHVSAEQSLGEACEKFIRRFQKVEELAGARGLDMKSAGVEELDKLCNEAKETKNSQD